MTALTFAYAGFSVRVHTSNQADLEWLREFLVPDFDVSALDSAHRTVTFSTDGPAFAELVARGAHPSGQSVGCFALDGRMETHPRWAAPDDELVAFDERSRTFCRRDGAGAIQIVADPGKRAARAVLLRAVRETVTAALDESAVVIHGASLEWRGRGYVFAGHKGAGKTTLLLHLLSGTAASFVANDRVVAFTREPSILLRGMPTIVKVRGSSGPQLPAFARRALGTPYHHRWTIAEAEAREGSTPADAAAPALSITPAQLVRLLGGVKRATNVSLGAIVFPRQTGRPGGFSLRRLPEPLAAARVRAALLRSGTSLVGELFAQAGRSVSHASRDAACASIAARVPCLECSMGVEVYDGPASAEVLMAALEAAAGTGATEIEK